MCTPGKRGYKPDRFSGDHADRPAPHPPQQVPFGHAPCGASSVPVPVRPRSRSRPCALCRHPHRVRARSRSRRQGGSRLAPVDARDEASPGTSLEAPCPARHPRPRRESPQPLGIESGGLSVRIDRHAPRRKSSGLSSDCPAWGTDTGWKRCRPPASRSSSREMGSQTSSTGSTPHRRRWGFPPRSARECGRCANWGSKSSTFGMPR